MQTKPYRALHLWLRDMVLGALAFVVVSLSLASTGEAPLAWNLNQAAAGEVIATRVIDVTAPAGPQAENAVVAAAQMRPAADPLLMRRIGEMTIMGLTFSLLFAFNMAFWRHLQRIDATSRRPRS